MGEEGRIGRPERSAAAGRVALSFAALAALAGGIATPVLAGAAHSVTLELNKVEERPGGCRFYLLFANRSAETYSDYRLDLVVFDADSVIARRFAVDLSPMRAKKTTVKLFDVSGVACRDIGKVLLNDILSCAIGKDRKSGCIEKVAVTSRTGIGFAK